MKRIALITGVAKSNGIGAACARQLSAQGYLVIAADVAAAGVRGPDEPSAPTAGGLEQLAAELIAASGEASSVTGDISTEEGPAAMIDYAVQTYGRLDVLVNNAAARASERSD